MGSITGGGRYDKLIGMYGKKDIPAVGFSVGVERIFTMMEEAAKKNKATFPLTRRAPFARRGLKWLLLPQNPWLVL